MHQAQGARLTLRLEILAHAPAPGRIQDEQRARGWSRSFCLPGWVARNLTDLSGLACHRHRYTGLIWPLVLGPDPRVKSRGQGPEPETAPGIPRGCSVGSLPPISGSLERETLGS